MSQTAQVPVRTKAKPMLPDWPRIMRREKAAQYLDISPATLDQAVASGKMPKPIPITGTIKGWVRDDLDAWIEDRRTAPLIENDWD